MYISDPIIVARNLYIHKQKTNTKKVPSKPKIDCLAYEYRQLVLSPKVTFEGETRLMEIMRLAINNDQLASAISEVDLKIGVAIGAIPPFKAKTAVFSDVEA